MYSCSLFLLVSSTMALFTSRTWRTASMMSPVPASTHERNAEGPLVDVEKRVGRRQDFGLVDHVDAHGLEGPGLGLVSDPAFGHHGDRHGIHNLLNPDRIGHARNPAG